MIVSPEFAAVGAMRFTAMMGRIRVLCAFVSVGPYLLPAASFQPKEAVKLS